jgi:hypothetical protein
MIPKAKEKARSVVPSGSLAYKNTRSRKAARKDISKTSTGDRTKTKVGTLVGAQIVVIRFR